MDALVRGSCCSPEEEPGIAGAAVCPVLAVQHVQHVQLSLTPHQLCSRNHDNHSLNVFQALGVKRIHLSGAISLFSPFWSMHERTAVGVTGHGSRVNTQTFICTPTARSGHGGMVCQRIESLVGEERRSKQVDRVER